jgi:hypothetical protein
MRVAVTSLLRDKPPPFQQACFRCILQFQLISLLNRKPVLLYLCYFVLKPVNNLYSFHSELIKSLDQHFPRLHKSLACFLPCLPLFQPPECFGQSSFFLLCEGSPYIIDFPHIPNIEQVVALAFSQMNLHYFDNFGLSSLADLIGSYF